MDNQKLLKQVTIIDKDGTVVYPNTKIAPDAEVVMIQPTADTGTKATLQNFLFGKFIDEENGIRKKAEDGYAVNPDMQSIWQAWTDHQDIIQKRLVGLYDKNGDYIGDFLLKIEKNDPADTQAQYTLFAAPVDQTSEDYADKIQQIANLFNLTEDAVLDGAPNYDKDGKLINLKTVSAKEQAEALMISFGNQSFWQTFLEREQLNKDKIFGIYAKTDNGVQCIGHFEATRNNINALKEVYKKGFNIGTGAADENNNIKTIQWGQIDTDEEAMGLLVDLSKKSIYQHLIELKDFWITLPFEEYETGIGDNYGLNIVNKNDILSLHFADNTLSEEATKEVE